MLAYNYHTGMDSLTCKHSQQEDKIRVPKSYPKLEGTIDCNVSTGLIIQGIVHIVTYRDCVQPPDKQVVGMFICSSSQANRRQNQLLHKRRVLYIRQGLSYPQVRQNCAQDTKT
jgi:hypothetical protein